MDQQTHLETSASRLSDLKKAHAELRQAQSDQAWAQVIVKHGQDGAFGLTVAETVKYQERHARAYQRIVAAMGWIAALEAVS